uniref:Tubulin-tyrosine ligase n=1 Tax=viral metagenome TaxID=1070528 RepID=A0A6C0K185_9ZZZZ
MVTYRFNAHTKEIDDEIQALFRSRVPSSWKQVKGDADIELLMAIPIVPLKTNPNVKLLNVLTGPSKYILTVKSRLYERFSNYSWVPPSVTITDTIPSFRSLKILKPTEGYRGMGISLVHNKKEVEEWIAQNTEYKEWVLQSYIQPCTFRKHKFHLRVYLLINCSQKGIRSAWLANTWFLVQAIKPYQNSDYKNKEIHDTHMKHGHLFHFPQDKPDGWDDGDVRTGYRKVVKIMQTLLTEEHRYKPDWRAQNGFQVFGADIMFQEGTHKPFILEFNTKAELGLKEVLMYYPSFYQHSVGDMYGIDFLQGSPDLFDRIM